MCAGVAALVTVALGCYAGAATVTAHVVVARTTGGRPQHADTVVWLSQLQPAPYSFGEPVKPARLVQKNKTFEPHLLVVRTGSVVEFPNEDPFFHNVFSLFDGKRFDLGLYEAGSTRSVRFDRPGISYIFCNIHAQMSAVVIAVDTPYYAISSRHGNITVSHVPPGKYILQLWREGSSPKVLNGLRREVVVTDADTSLGSLSITEDELPVAHKNKYGRDYEDAQPANSAYPQP
jgi:plastocyanin